MKFKNNTRKYLCCLLLVHFFLYSYSQNTEHGIPSFYNIPPYIYGQKSQNFSVVQDQNHFMYFGNANGIIKYDNIEWQLIPISGKPIMDINSKNEIFFGAYNQIGKLVFENGKITPLFLDIDNNYGQVNKIIAFDNEVFISTNNQLLVYQNNSVQVVLSNKEGINIFNINNKLYIFIPNQGIYIWKENKIVIAENMRQLRFIHIQDMYELNEKQILIKPKDRRGFIILEDGKIKNFRTSVDIFLENNEYSVSRVLKNGSIIIGTKFGGLVCIDNKGKLVFSLNRNNGLRDNHITDLHIDFNNQIWASTYNGISLIQTPAPFEFFDSSFGLNGSILSIKKFNDKLYVATSTGVYKYFYGNIYDFEEHEFNNRKRFKKIEGINDISFELSIILNNLFAVTSSGIFQIHTNQAVKILEGQYNTIFQSVINPEICLIGGKKGLLISKFSETAFDNIGYIENFNYGVSRINEESDGTVWIGTNTNDLFQLNFNGNYTNLNTSFEKYNETNYINENLNLLSLFNTSQGTLFSTQKGLFYYDSFNNVFNYDTILNYDYKSKSIHIYPILEDNNNNIWFSKISSEDFFRKTGVAQFDKNYNSYTKITNPFSLIRKFPIETIYFDNQHVWYGTSDFLIKFNYDYINYYSKKAPCYIRKIRIGKDSTINIPPDFNFKENIFEFLHSDNIRIDFTYLQFNTYGDNKFQIILEGFDSDTLEWAKTNYKEYAALRGGNYTFKVRAKDIYGNISTEAIIIFNVKPPIYRTFYAYLFYLLFVAIIIYLLLKFNELRHAKEHYRLEKLVEDRTNELAYQKEQTEKLVKKLLPDYTADEIKQTGQVKSKKYEMVSVLFADIQGFTKIAEKEKPEELIKSLNNIFSSFDKIIIKYKIQKIKTIGDAYMCAGGVPVANKTNPIEVVLAGIEMQNQIKLFEKERKMNIKLRIGVHTGEVVTGVVGSNKLEYDIWGDTVNIASRMESHGLVNKVNISKTTYNYVQDFFNCKRRGMIKIKYKGEIEMFLVDRIKPELAEILNPSVPNRQFFVKLQHIKLRDIQEEVLEQLEKNLPKNLYYHNLKHTLNVLYVVEYFAQHEKVNEEEILLLKCAALFHDAGFLVSYDNNEKIGAEMAAQTLKKYNFSQEQIETVKRLIMATQMPQQPKDLLEEIICDADLDYLGRADFIPISQNLFRELFERGKINTIQEWNELQYKFMDKHKFFTETARRKREPIKKLVMEELKNLI